MVSKSIDDIRNVLDEDTVTCQDLFDEAVSMANKYQDEFNSFVTIIDNKEEYESSSILSGIPYVLKDNISTEGNTYYCIF